MNGRETKALSTFTTHHSANPHPALSLTNKVPTLVSKQDPARIQSRIPSILSPGVRIIPSQRRGFVCFWEVFQVSGTEFEEECPFSASPTFLISLTICKEQESKLQDSDLIDQHHCCQCIEWLSEKSQEK